MNEKTEAQTFEELLAGSVAAHGHLCPGQIVGVRLAILGLRLLGFRGSPDVPSTEAAHRLRGDGPLHRRRRGLCHQGQAGRRSLKFVDYGIMAATFVNLETGRAFRIISTEESRELAALYAPGEPDRRRQQLQAYKVMPDSVMFRVQEVKVNLSPFDMPGPTRRKATCIKCGQVVRDNREVSQRRPASIAGPAPRGPISPGPRRSPGRR